MTRRRAPVAALAAVIYLPLLMTKPGRVVADTKSYLYLDPSRMLSRAWSMWDPNVGLGTVTHQNIGYLWPMGPWFWCFDRLGIPDWVAQRLWIGSILFLAGLGTLWLLRTVLGWATLAATVAAFAYAFTPYTLSLAARISVILLPFAGLPWLIGLAVRAVRRGGWADPARFALVVATVGSVNATAILLVGLAPVLWLVHVVVAGEVPLRRAVATALRIGLCAVPVSLWWIAGLWAQGGYGIDVLRYTETAEVVASASVSTEVLRGLGYWFFYGGDRLGPWIEPGHLYTQRLALLALTYGLTVAALAGAARTRFAHRSYFVSLFVLGTLAAVGAHPWGDPPAAGRALQAVLRVDAGLAMRSLPRAVPLVALALAAFLGAGAGALVDALQPRVRALARPIGAGLCALAYLAYTPLWTLGMVPANLDRAADVPGYWLEAAATLDAGGARTRVLEVPGIDFASYRWGNTVDPITPGLIDRPYVARELIPYGSPASADLLNALDSRIQERTLDPGALAVVARMLGVGEIVLRNDLQYERFRTARPYVLAPLLDAEPGLRQPPVPFGPLAVNTTVADVPLLDELALAADDGARRPPVAVYSVENPVEIVRTHSGAGVVVAGDGQGLLDLAAADLIHGDELVRYAASLGADGIGTALDEGAIYVITDGNRRQGRRWSSLWDTLGHVERAAREPIVEDLSDNRLPVFPDAGDEWFTTSVPSGDVVADATSYGNPVTFTPEFRPANAIDADPATEWRTGGSADIRGERLVLTFDPLVRADSVRLVQQLGGRPNRHLTAIDLRVDGGPAQRVALDAASLSDVGQAVALAGGESTIRRLEITLVADSSGRVPRPGRPVRFNGLSTVGFAEVDVAGRTSDEALLLPPAATAAIPADGPWALVLTRWRTDPANTMRDDPEPAMARRWSQPVARGFLVLGTARLSSRAGDAVLDALLGVTGPAVTGSSRLAGDATARGSAALDGDPATAWSPAFADAEPALNVVASGPVTFDRLDPSVVDDGRRSVPTRLRIEADGAVAETVDLTRGGEPVVLSQPVTATSFRFVVEAMEERTTIDWHSSAAVVVPPAIAELGIPSLAVDVPEGFDTGCRTDLLTLDGQPVAVRLVDTVAPALTGEAAGVVPCESPLSVGAGIHDLRAAAGRDTGIDIDRVVMASEDVIPPDAGAGRGPRVAVVDEGRASMRVHIDGATPGEPFWLVLGQSFNEGWRASGGLGRPELVDGFANGWFVTPVAAAFDVDLAWTPQRSVTNALRFSLLAALVCLWLARRRPADPPPFVPLERDRKGTIQSQTRRVALAAGLLGVLFIGWVAGTLLALAALAAGRRASTHRLLRSAPAVLYGLAAAYVVGRQAISRPTSAFEWPAEQGFTHQLGLLAVATLAVSVALDYSSDRQPRARLRSD